MLMKTKQILTLSTLATLLMASCSKDNITSVNPGDAIRVNAFVNAASKADEVTSDNFNQFKLYGFAQTSHASNFEDTYTGTLTSGWTPALGKHYWPSSATETMDFLAHSPSNLEAAFLVKPTVSFALETLGTPQALPSSVTIAGVKPKTHAKDQVDFLISRNKGINSQGASSGVSLLFKHALTQVAVKAKCSNSNMIVKVKGVKLGNFMTNNTFTYPNNTITNAANAMQNIWGTPTETTSYMAGGTATEYLAVPLTAEYQDITSGDNFMIIPQSSLTAWNPSTPNGSGAYIAVLCQIYQGTESAGNLLFPSDVSKWGFAAVGIGNTLTPGTKTTINLEFFAANGGGAGNIPPDKTDPTNPTDPEIDADTGDAGDPIVGGAISFSVDVTGWGDGFAGVDGGGEVTMPN